MNAILDRFVGNISPVALLVSSFFWSWFDIVPFSPALFTAAGVPFDMNPMTISLGVSAAVLALFSLRGGLRAFALEARAFALCSLVCGTGGAVLIYLGAVSAAPSLLIAGGVLIGIYEGWGALVVGGIATCQGTTNALIHLATALPLNIVAVLLVAFLQPVASVVFAAQLPLCSALCYTVFVVRGHNLATLKSTLVARATRKKREGRKPLSESNVAFLAVVLVATAAFGFVNLQAMFVPGDEGSFTAYVSLVIRAATSAVVFIGYLRFSWRPYTILCAALLFMAVGLVASGVADAGFASALFLAGYLCFDVLIWAIVIMMNYRSGMALLRTISIVYALDQFGIFAGTIAGSAARDVGTVAMGCVVLGSALLLLMVWLSNRSISVKDSLKGYELEFDQRKDDPSQAESPADDTAVPAVREGRIAEMKARYFLSSREVDILSLLVAGRNGPYIAEHLCVSDNTVKTHIRHIYTKLDVHNRQELLDLVLSSGN